MSFQNQILGTIISSVLDYDQLNDAINETRGCHPNSSFAPCDGRSVEGSRIAPILHQNTQTFNVPDLRGKFLRGLNLFHAEGQNPFNVEESDPDGLNRKPGEYQGDTFESHSHREKANATIGASLLQDGRLIGLGNNEGSQGVLTNYFTEEVGKTETSPKNISLYFYIKIN